MCEVFPKTSVDCKNGVLKIEINAKMRAETKAFYKSLLGSLFTLENRNMTITYFKEVDGSCSIQSIKSEDRDAAPAPEGTGTSIGG